MILVEDSDNVPKLLLVDGSQSLYVTPLGSQTMIKKTADWTGAVTGTTVWDPTTGTKFVITAILINASAACTLTLFDETDDTTNRIFKADLAANANVIIPFPQPMISAAADNILKITTSATGGYLTVFGYEI